MAAFSIAKLPDDAFVSAAMADECSMVNLVWLLTCWCPAGFGDFRKKHKHTWLCVGIPPDR